MAAMDSIYTVSIWLLPVLIASRFLGDDTAARKGRVTLNPVRHIDPFGTIILPGLLLLARSPFLFGYAKPVPVNFRALHPPRIGMVLVAAAGPLMNIGLAVAAALAFPLVIYLPNIVAQWAALNLKNGLISIFDFFFSPLFAFENSFCKSKCAGAIDHNAPSAVTRHPAQLVSRGV